MDEPQSRGPDSAIPGERAGHDDARYWIERQRKLPPIQAVGYRSKSAAFNRWMYRARWRTLHAVLDRILPGIGSPVRVLDVGCGAGFFVDLWRGRPEFGELVGLDVSPDAIAALRSRFPEQRFEVAEAGGPAELPVEGHFEIVQAIDVLYHITDEGRFERALAQMAARIRPGGYLLASDNFPSRNTTSAPHVRLRSRTAYQRVLSGFEPVLEVPQFLFLNAPSGISAGWLRGPLVRAWEALTWPARYELPGAVLGAVAYGADRLLLPLVGSRTPSTKLAAWRKG